LYTNNDNDNNYIVLGYAFLRQFYMTLNFSDKTVMLSESRHPTSFGPKLNEWEKGGIIAGSALVVLIFGYILYFCINWEREESAKLSRDITEFDEVLPRRKTNKRPINASKVSGFSTESEKLLVQDGGFFAEDPELS